MGQIRRCLASDLIWFTLCFWILGEEFLKVLWTTFLFLKGECWRYMTWASQELVRKDLDKLALDLKLGRNLKMLDRKKIPSFLHTGFIGFAHKVVYSIQIMRSFWKITSSSSPLIEWSCTFIEGWLVRAYWYYKKSINLQTW